MTCLSLQYLFCLFLLFSASVHFLGTRTVMKPPPPRPDENMLTTPVQNVAAMAASTAVPFCFKTIAYINGHLGQLLHPLCTFPALWRLRLLTINTNLAAPVALCCDGTVGAMGEDGGVVSAFAKPRISPVLDLSHDNGCEEGDDEEGEEHTQPAHNGFGKQRLCRSPLAMLS